MVGDERNDSSVVALGTRLAIIRHGEAYCNIESFIGGHLGCRGLTPRGVRQVEVLAKRLVETNELQGAAALYTSILPRAIESTELLLDALQVKIYEATCSLCERHPGIADGMTWEAYEERYRRPSLPGDEPELALSEGGETWIEFLDHAQQSLCDVAAAHPGGLVVIVAHGGIIDASMIRFFKVTDHGLAVRLHPEHTSITEWEFVGTRWRLIRYNDAAHLGMPEFADLRTPTPAWVQQDLL